MSEYLSRSEKKRIFKQVKELAAEIADLSDKELKKFPGGPVLHDEILATRGLKGGAKNRQIKYLAKVLRQGSVEEVYQFVKDKKGSQLHTKKIFHAAERMRDSIINEAVAIHKVCLSEQISFENDWPSESLVIIIDKFPNINETELRTVVYQYVTTRKKLHYRELFRMMKAAVEQKERLGTD